MYCLFEKTENKRKRGRGWPIFLKKKTLFKAWFETIWESIFERKRLITNLVFDIFRKSFSASFSFPSPLNILLWWKKAIRNGSKIKRASTYLLFTNPDHLNSYKIWTKWLFPVFKRHICSSKDWYYLILIRI